MHCTQPPVFTDLLRTTSTSMNQQQHSTNPQMDNARQLVRAVVTILEKLHGEGFLASGVFPNLGLTKVKSALDQSSDEAALAEMDRFLKNIESLFTAQKLLHPSATEKFVTLFGGYLEAATLACTEATTAGIHRPAGKTLH